MTKQPNNPQEKLLGEYVAEGLLTRVYGFVIENGVKITRIEQTPYVDCQNILEVTLQKLCDSAWSLGLQGASPETLANDRSNSMTVRKAEELIKANYYPKSEAVLKSELRDSINELPQLGRINNTGIREDYIKLSDVLKLL